MMNLGKHSDINDPSLRVTQLEEKVASLQSELAKAEKRMEEISRENLNLSSTLAKETVRANRAEKILREIRESMEQNDGLSANARHVLACAVDGDLCITKEVVKQREHWDNTTIHRAFGDLVKADYMKLSGDPQDTWKDVYKVTREGGLSQS